MLDIKEIRSNPALVVDRLLKRGVVFDTQTFSSLDSKRKAAVVRSQSLQAERKVVSGKVGQLILPSSYSPSMTSNIVPP